MQSPSARVLEELLHGKTVAADDNKSFRCVLAAENDVFASNGTRLLSPFLPAMPRT